MRQTKRMRVSQSDFGARAVAISVTWCAGLDRHMRQRGEAARLAVPPRPRVAARRLTLKKGSLGVNFPTVHTERRLSGRRIEGGGQRGWSG